MKKFKLYDILQVFTPKEFDEFGLFLDSPFFNSSKNVKKVYKIISPYYPEFTHKKLTKQCISGKIYPNEIYRDKKIRDLFSKTLELAEDYLAYIKIKNDTLLLKSYSLSQLASRNLGKHFEQKSKETDTLLSKMGVKDSSYFFYNHKLLKEKREYHEYKMNLGKREGFFADIDKEIDQFVLHFVLNILTYYFIQHNQKRIIKHDSHFELLDEILAYLEKRQIKQYPQIFLIYNTVLLMKYPERVEIFYILRKLLNDNSSSIEKDIQIDAFIALYNYSKERVLHEDASFKKEYFNIIKEMIEKKLYPLEENYLPEHTYISFTGEGLIHKDYPWTEKFIEQHKDIIRPDRRENAYNYCLATLNYRLKNYDKALKLLAKVKTQDFYYTLRVKNHFLKIYFETSQFESVINLVDSFRHFLINNKSIPDYISTRFISYVNFLGRVCNAIFSKDISNLQSIKTEITGSQNFENRAWMLEQIDRILAK
jgi:hypothetical protein